MPETTVQLGNVNPKDGAQGPNVTTFVVPAGVNVAEALLNTQRVYSQEHSNDPPEWVEVTGMMGLAEAIASVYTWESGYESDVPSEEALEEVTVEGLQFLAQERGVTGTSSMKKADLIDALRQTYWVEGHECVVGAPEDWQPRVDAAREEALAAVESMRQKQQDEQPAPVDETQE